MNDSLMCIAYRTEDKPAKRIIIGESFCYYYAFCGYSNAPLQWSDES